jgi:phage terminase small subunit
MGIRPITPKRRAFIREYLIDHNATQAAIRAGYAAHSADVQSAQLLGYLRKEVAEAEAKISKKLEVTAERIVAELASVAFANQADYTGKDNEILDLSGLSRDKTAAISEITVDTTGGSGDGERKAVLRTRIKRADKVKALELLGRHLEMFTDKVKVSGNLYNCSDEELAERLNKLESQT